MELYFVYKIAIGSSTNWAVKCLSKPQNLPYILEKIFFKEQSYGIPDPMRVDSMPMRHIPNQYEYLFEKRKKKRLK